MKQKFDIEFFKQWASAYWYVKIFDDYCLVIKGKTHKKFKFAKYETTEELISDIQWYMAHDYCQWRTKR